MRTRRCEGHQKDKPYERALLEIAKRLVDQQYLFAVAISILLVGLASFAAVLGSPDVQLIAILIAFLAFTAIVLSFAAKFAWVDERQKRQQELINRLVTLSMSPSVFRKLVGVTIFDHYLYRENVEFKDGKDENGDDVVGQLFS
jgi:multisubunit Na+/H+ antiporter MnhB subunit